MKGLQKSLYLPILHSSGIWLNLKAVFWRLGPWCSQLNGSFISHYGFFLLLASQLSVRGAWMHPSHPPPLPFPMLHFSPFPLLSWRDCHPACVHRWPAVASSAPPPQQMNLLSSLLRWPPTPPCLYSDTWLSKLFSLTLMHAKGPMINRETWPIMYVDGDCENRQGYDRTEGHPRQLLHVLQIWRKTDKCHVVAIGKKCWWIIKYIMQCFVGLRRYLPTLGCQFNM